MRNSLKGKQVLIDVVLDYLERKYGLQLVSGLSVVERVWRLREQIDSMYDINRLRNKYNSKARGMISFDDFGD